MLNNVKDRKCKVAGSKPGQWSLGNTVSEFHLCNDICLGVITYATDSRLFATDVSAKFKVT